MNDVVEAVGLEKSSLYGHFASKEALAISVFEYAWTETFAARIAGIEDIESAIEKLKAHAHNALSLSFPGGCPLPNTIIETDDGNPTLRKIARNALKKWRLSLQNIIIEGQERDEILPEIEADDIAVLIISLLEGAMAFDRLDKKSGYLEKAGGILTSISMQLLAGPLTMWSHFSRRCRRKYLGVRIGRVE